MHDSYVNPLCTRYASRTMRHIFSDDFKFSTWRKLWVALAESEMEMGLPVTREQVEELKAHIYDIDYEMAAEEEKRVRHDVMAHVHTYGAVCPNAKGIIHLGATSCFVGDNTDLIQMHTALLEIRKLIINTLSALAQFMDKWKEQPTLAFTHFQAAQPTTVGKRATLWAHDLLLDLERLDFELSHYKLRCCKGTTGTGASFLELFKGDTEKVAELDRRVAKKMGFDRVFPVSGQTYSRKVDFNILSVLSGIAQSAAKFSNDIRLLSHLKEFDEPFEAGQIGSSAMAYKRNPMRSERIASLARYVMADLTNPAITAATQWFERTLDDSANRRISIPEAFLAVDAILQLYINIVRDGNPYPKVMERHLNEELPFLATENIMMHCVEKGGDRQELHEAIRQHSVAVAKKMKLEGGDNDLLDRIAGDERFGISREELNGLLDVKQFVGCSTAQTEAFLELIRPILEENKDALGAEVSINV